MTNPNLVPTPVTDKNGVRSTRWTKPKNTSAQPLPPLPPPSVPSAPGRTEYLESLRNAFRDDPRLTWFDTDVLGTLETDTLIQLDRFIGDSTSEDTRRIASAAYYLEDHSTDERLLRELFTYHDALSGCSQKFIAHAISHLHRCTELPQMDDYSTATGVDRQAVFDALRATAEARLESNERYYFDESRPAIIGHRTRALLHDYPEHEEQIMELVKQRGEDVEMIRSIIFSATPSISEGQL